MGNSTGDTWTKVKIKELPRPIGREVFSPPFLLRMEGKYGKYYTVTKTMWFGRKLLVCNEAAGNVFDNPNYRKECERVGEWMKIEGVSYA